MSNCDVSQFTETGATGDLSLRKGNAANAHSLPTEDTHFDHT